MKHLKWGIIGAGRIAGRFAEGLSMTKQATGLAIGSRSLQKAKDFAQRYQMPRAYGSYDDLLADPDVDAVYIALPNHLHAEWSIKSAQAGKHILCEKPVTMNAAELKKVLRAVKKNDVFFMEAFMYRCHPQWKKVLEIIEAGDIGEVRTIYSALAINLGPQFDNYRMQHRAGGGALLDVGCYCVSFCRLIAQQEPAEVRAIARIGKRSRVDEVGAALLRFPSDIVANISFAIQCKIPTAAEIYGSKGSISITNPWFPLDYNASIIVNAGDKTKKYDIKHSRRLDLAGNSPADPKSPLHTHEALIVAKYVDQRQAPPPAMTWADSLGQMRTLDMIRADIGLVWECEKG